MTRIQYFDGLRGGASLLVVAHHFLMAFYPALYWPSSELVHTGNAWEMKIHGTPLSLFANGGLAVAVFLVLSGYVLTMQFKKQGQIQPFLGYFGVNRFVRFFLLMLVTNIVAYLAMISGFADNIHAAALTQSWGWLGNQWKMIPSFIEAVSQSLMGLFYMYPIDQVYNSSIWTMPLFFLGGFLVAIVFQLTAALKHPWVLYGLLLVVLVRGNYYLLLVGMMLYEYKLFSRPFFSHPLLVGLLMVVGLFFGGYPYIYQTSNVSWWYSWLPVLNFTYTSTFYHAISAVALVILLINNHWLQRIFSLKVLTYFGTRSFSLYLVHIVVILSITSRLFVTLSSHVDYSLAVGISSGLSLLVVGGITEFLYQVVERRSSLYSKYIYRRLAQKVQ